jgi:hypothetical protein
MVPWKGERMSMYLFLGGSKDGEDMGVADDMYVVHVAVEPEPELHRQHMPPSMVMAGPQIETYRIAKLRGETQIFEAFVPEHWNGDDVMRHLMERARKPKP